MVGRIALLFVLLMARPAAADEPVAAATFGMPAISHSEGHTLTAGTAVVQAGDATSMLSSLRLQTSLTERLFGELLAPGVIAVEDNQTMTFVGNITLGLHAVSQIGDGTAASYGVRVGLPTPSSEATTNAAAVAAPDHWTLYSPRALSSSLVFGLELDRPRWFVQMRGAIDVGKTVDADAEKSSTVTSVTASVAGGYRLTSQFAVVYELAAVAGAAGPAETSQYVGFRAGARYQRGASTVGAFLTAPTTTDIGSDSRGVGVELSRPF